MILLKYRDVEAKSPVITKCRTQGIWRFKLWNEHGIKQQGEVKNLITNIGLDRFGAGSSQFAAWCHVGTGTNAPAFSDAALGNFVASSNTTLAGNVTGQYVSGTPDYSFATRIFRFAAGVATGNLTEVAASWQGTTGGIFSRALFLDETLAPIVISKGAIDVLDIEYEVRLYAQWDDAVGTMSIGGTSRNFIVRACSVETNVGVGLQWGVYSAMVGANYLFAGQVAPAYAYTTDLVPRTTSLGSSGSLTSGLTGSRSTYVNGTYYTDITNTFGIDYGNAGPSGIRKVGFGQNNQGNTKAFQCQFDPPLEKDNTKSLTLTLRISWDRA